jgi:hypothetical protein
MIEETDLLKVANVRPNWDVFLERLAEVAAPEIWSKPKADQSEKPRLVLSNLVRQTFRRAVHVGAIAYGNHDGTETFAFSPRLRTVSFEAIYLVAHKTPPAAGGRIWKLDSICREPEARRFLGYAPKEKLPGAPSFWDDPADLIVDPEILRKIDVDYEHLATNDRFLHLFPAELQSDPMLRTFALERAIEVMVERACENPRIGAPVFTFDSATSGDGQVRLCLPLHLKATTVDRRTADLALVVDPKFENGELVQYEPKTLVSTDDVYLQSRIFETPSGEVWPRP